MYTPENYIVHYAPHGNCHLSDSNTEGLNSSNAVYTPNNQTLTKFFFEMDVEFSVELVGLIPSTNYCCVLVASNSYGSTVSELFSFQTEADGKQCIPVQSALFLTPHQHCGRQCSRTVSNIFMEDMTKYIND